MIYTTNSQQPRTISDPQVEIPEGATLEQELHLKQLKHASEGVLFHTYQRDAYAVLCLNGFKKFHDKRVCEETKELDKSKDHYICRNGILPVFKVDVDFWEDNKDITSKLERDEIGETVHKLMDELIDWENETLNLYLELKSKSKDRKKYYCLIKDQLQVVDFLEQVDHVLNRYGYSYEAVCEMNQYLGDK